MADYDEDIVVDSAEDIRKQGHTYQSFLYKHLTHNPTNISTLFGSQNSPEGNSRILQEIFNMHFAIATRKASKDYLTVFFPAMYKEVQEFMTKANSSSNSVSASDRIQFQKVIHKWMDRLAHELRTSDFTPPVSKKLVVGHGTKTPPRKP